MSRCDPPTTGFWATAFGSECPFVAAWGVEALSGSITEPAWRSKKSWYLVVTDDKMIPVAAQRQMAKRAGSVVTEVGGSHAIYVSNPKVVAEIIDTAAKGTAK